MGGVALGDLDPDNTSRAHRFLYEHFCAGQTVACVHARHQKSRIVLSVTAYGSIRDQAFPRKPFTLHQLRIGCSALTQRTLATVRTRFG